jgi:hypothetical protein
VRIDGRKIIDGRLVDILNGALGPFLRVPARGELDAASGGGYIRVPLPFRRSMRVTTQSNPNYYHVIYRRFAAGDRVPPFRRLKRVPRPLRTAGDEDPKPGPRGVARVRFFDLPGHGPVRVLRLRGSGSISELGLRFPTLDSMDPVLAADLLRRARLRISFDGHRTVEAPLGEFFGSGFAPAKVRSLMFRMGPNAGNWLRAWWPMPYGRSATISLTNPTGTPVPGGVVQVRFDPSPRRRAMLRDGREGYFHATSNGPAPTVRGRDWPFLRTRGRGTFVGVVQTMRADTTLYMEGDERVYVDGERDPSLHGTGTEDFYEGGWLLHERLHDEALHAPPERLPDGARPVLGLSREGLPLRLPAHAGRRGAVPALAAVRHRARARERRGRRLFVHRVLVPPAEPLEESANTGTAPRSGPVPTLYSGTP